MKMLNELNFFRIYGINGLKAVLTSFLFFIIPASLVIIAGVESTVFLVMYIGWLMTFMNLLLLGILYLSTKILIETLKNYSIDPNFDYKLLFWTTYIVIGVIITIACQLTTLAFQ